MPSYSVRYAIAQNQTNSSVSLATTTTTTQCTYNISSSTNITPEPMPHQVILCIGNTYCEGSYMIVSLYDYQQYMQNFETLLTYEKNGIDFWDIHSLSQGKYMTVGISETRPDQSKA